MRRLVVFAAASVFASGFSLAAVAQNQPADPLAGIEEAEEDEELSELERLSRSEDDPFAGVIESEQREPVSVTLRALNKTTARYTDIEIEMNQIARFGSLEIQPRTCDKRPPEEFPETTAFLEIFDTEYNNRESAGIRCSASGGTGRRCTAIRLRRRPRPGAHCRGRPASRRRQYFPRMDVCIIPGA